jgi:mannosyltransferase
MTVHIDGIIFSLQRHGGISVYFRELLERLQRDRIDAQLSLEAPLLQDALPPAQTRSARRLERYRDCRPLAEGRTATVYHSSYYRLPQGSTARQVVTVHDFAYERCQSGPRRWVHSAQKNRAIRAAQDIICISAATRDDLLDLVGLRSGQRLHVIHNGVSDRFHPLPDETPSGPPFVLFVGQRGRYKNFGLALQALAYLPEVELHCIGGGPLGEAELAAVPPAVRARVRHLGQVSDEALNQLYNRAQCLAYPSAYEGFGIPVIEAMRAGCPVVSIACKAVQEVGGAALQVSATDPEEFAHHVQATMEPERRRELRQLGLQVASAYSWEACYQATLAVYRGQATPCQP